VKKRIGAAVAAVLTAAGALFGIVQTQKTEYPDTGHHYDPAAVYEIPATQDIVFKAVPYARDTWGLPRTLPNVIGAARDAMLSHRALEMGFQVRPQVRDWWSEPEQLNDALLRYTSHLAGSEVEAVWYIRAVSDGYKWKAKSTDQNPAAILNTTGTQAIDILVGTVVQAYPKVESLGLCVCKRISGSNTYSQHSWCNGFDMKGPGPWGSRTSVAYLDDIAAYLSRLDAKGYVPLAQLIWRGTSHYPGHIHLSGDPMHTGTPPCAR